MNAPLMRKTRVKKRRNKIRTVIASAIIMLTTGLVVIMIVVTAGNKFIEKNNSRINFAETNVVPGKSIDENVFEAAISPKEKEIYTLLSKLLNSKDNPSNKSHEELISLGLDFASTSFFDAVEEYEKNAHQQIADKYAMEIFEIKQIWAKVYDYEKEKTQ